MRLEEEQPRVAQLRISLFLGFGVDIDEAVGSMVAEIVAHLHSLVGVDVVVPGQVELFQRRTAPIARIHRKYQPPVVTEGRVVHHVADAGLAVVISIHCLRNYGWLFCLT